MYVYMCFRYKFSLIAIILSMLNESKECNFIQALCIRCFYLFLWKEKKRMKEKVSQTDKKIFLFLSLICNTKKYLKKERMEKIYMFVETFVAHFSSHGKFALLFILGGWIVKCVKICLFCSLVFEIVNDWKFFGCYDENENNWKSFWSFLSLNSFKFA